MSQRGAVGALRVGALERLVELLRVAEQDEAVGRPRHRDDVGERDLARLVDEQDIDGVGHLRRRPQPRRAGGQVGPAVVEPGADIGSVLAPGDTVVDQDLLLLALLDGPDVDPFDRRRP